MQKIVISNLKKTNIPRKIANLIQDSSNILQDTGGET